MIRVLVADRRDIFRSGVRALLEREGDFAVVTAADLPSAVSTAERGVDVGLVDLELPPEGGVAAVRALCRACSACMVVWSFSPGRQTVLEAIRAGASGYLEKTVSPEALIRSVRAASRGEAVLQRDLVGLMIHALHDVDERVRAREQAASLSAREREVLDLVASGRQNREIAERLVISEFTVKRHVQNILHKLELPSRRAASAFWRAAFAPAGVEVGGWQ